MSAFPRDPEHFFRWVRTHHDPETQPQDFVPRRVYGDYVAGLLRPPPSTPATPASSAARSPSLGIDRRGDRFVVRLSSRPVDRGPSRRPRHRFPPGHRLGAGRRWPTSPRLVADPWTQELPDGDLLLVGTGLTMVDLAISADRPGRTLHTVSRHDLVPERPPPAHDARRPAAARASPGSARSTSCAHAVDAHVDHTVAETGDWRAAIDGLRPVTAQLWQGLGEDDKRRFLAEHSRTWGVHRHRMPPVTAERLARDRRRRAGWSATPAPWPTPARSPTASR